MKTFISFQDEYHRVQLVVFDPVGLLDKFVIYDNRKVVKTILDDESCARRCFYHYIGSIILQTGFKFPN